MNDTTTILPHIKLRFNIEHPSYEESYVYGYECALAEVSEEENPFKVGTSEAAQWSEGWWAGFYGEQPLFTLDEIPNEELALDRELAANDSFYQKRSFLGLVFEISGAIAASAIVGYQLLELVA